MISRSEKQKIIKVLLLIEANNHLSAHPIAMAERACNREAAIEILGKIVGKTPEEVCELYQRQP